MTINEIYKILKNSGLNAEFRECSHENWEEVTRKGKNVPAFYMEHYVNYQTVLFNSLSDSSRDISLILFHDNQPCGVWPLICDTKEEEPIKSINIQYGGVVIPPLFVENFPKKSQRKVIKSCITFINDLLRVVGGACWRTNEVSFDRDVSQWLQICLENGGNLDRVSYEMHLDLTMSIEDIRKHIRKSYRPLVSSGQKNWTPLVMDEHNEEIWNKFRALHKRVAGRVTRSIDTWNIQHQAIKDKHAFLVYILDSEGAMVAGGYFDMSSYQCQYSVASYDKGLSNQPLGHLVQYIGILTMKEKGRKMYYIGDRFYNENLPFVTNKQVDISHFKQGFSSKIFPRIGLSFHSVTPNAN